MCVVYEYLYTDEFIRWRSGLCVNCNLTSLCRICVCMLYDVYACVHVSMHVCVVICVCVSLCMFALFPCRRA